MSEMKSIVRNRVITTGNAVYVPNVAKKSNQSIKNNEFNKVFEKELKKCSNLKFSKHAQERLKSRNIIIDKRQMEKINDAVAKAKEKGVKDTLILMNNTAFVASVENRTIITAFQNEELKDNIFTNIDGAIII